MSFELSKKDKILLLGLLGVVFVFVAWYFVYTPLKENTTIIETENLGLKEKADLYQAINADLPKYEEGIEAYKKELVDIGNRYPAKIKREDEIMFLANMENAYSKDLLVENITMSSVIEILPADETPEAKAQQAATQPNEAATDATAADQEIAVPEVHMYKQPVNYSFRCTYEGAKSMITYVLTQSHTKAIEGMNLAFDTETGNLMGTMDLNQYYLVGLDREYQAIPVPVVPKGVNDVFHTVNGNAGVQATLQTEE